MDAFRKALNFLLSLRTAISLLLALLCVLFYGAFVMPVNEEFKSLQVVPLFQWLKESPLSVSWWIWTAMGIISVLTANTLFCSIESVTKKRGARNLLLALSPQVIHIGFLFVLLAHLLSSSGSFRGTAYVAEGTLLTLPDGSAVAFEAINTRNDPSGLILDWSADIRYQTEGARLKRDSIRPNSPSFHNGFGIYIKTVEFRPYPVALIEVSRDPGAVWALTGGLLFLAGMTTLLALKVRRES